MALYGYEIWFEGSVIREDKDTEFFTSTEAEAEATECIYSVMEEWNDNTIEFNDFEVVIREL